MLEPSAFADTWARKPGSAVAVGLRRLSEWDLISARAEAVKGVHEMHEDGKASDEDKVELFNDLLISEAVAVALCDPNDAAKPYFPAPQDDTRAALTSETIRGLWDDLCAMHRQSSMVETMLTDDEAKKLARILTATPIEMLHPATRRHLHAILVEDLREIDEPMAENDAVPQDEV